MLRTQRSLAATLGIVLLLAAAGCGLKTPGELPPSGEQQPSESQQSTNAGEVPRPESGNVLVNSGFEQGLEGWEVWDQRPKRSPGENVIETASWQERGGQVLHITRTSLRDGGASGVIQRPGIDVNTATSVKVSYVAYVNYEEGGNVGGGDPRWFPEGAAQVRVYYTAADGSKQEWYHGICIAPMENYDREHFTVIKDNVWTPYESPNLMELTPPPARIDEIRFYGFGWGFDAMMDDCFLIVER
ncbi:MAG: hypothetical protein QMC94_00705 [Anaerosomatales bacterium]|nr:hypothetical protein [Anaerosomatales bacterium]